MNPVDWPEMSRLFALLAQALKEEWQATPPRHDTLPSEALELAVDAWCCELAKNLNATPPAPPEVQPWILARLACAAIAAQDAGKRGFAPVIPNRPTIEQFLIGEWHGCWRDRWALMEFVK
ncbi:MAG: hypothetical protein WCH99_04935 [Verrucomicrobiota bacterium]